MKPMTLALCFCIGALAAVIFMRVANGAEPCDDPQAEVDALDAELASQIRLISYQPGRDDLMDPFEEPAPTSTVKVETEEPDPLDTAGEVVKSVRAGRWRDALAGAIVLMMIGLRRFRERIPFFSGDRGGAFLVMAVGLLSGASVALAAGANLGDWKLWFGIVSLAWSAAGSWGWFKKVLAPADADPLGPVWLRKMLGMG